jgi:hypothetical protein
MRRITRAPPSHTPNPDQTHLPALQIQQLDVAETRIHDPREGGRFMALLNLGIYVLPIALIPDWL